MFLHTTRKLAGHVPWLRRTAAAVVCATTLSLVSWVQAAEVGQPAPQLPVAATGAKVVYVDFWASWCGPCRESFPWMNAMQAKYGAQGLRIVGINVDQKPDDMKAFLKEFPASFEIVADPKGEQPKAWGVKGMPTAYLIDAQGVVRKVHQGFKQVQANELEASIRELLQSAKGGAK